MQNKLYIQSTKCKIHIIGECDIKWVCMVKWTLAKGVFLRSIPKIIILGYKYDSIVNGLCCIYTFVVDSSVSWDLEVLGDFCEGMYVFRFYILYKLLFSRGFYFRELHRSDPRGNFHFNLCLFINSNDNIRKITKLTPRKLPHLVQNCENNGVYSSCVSFVLRSFLCARWCIVTDIELMLNET